MNGQAKSKDDRVDSALQILRCKRNQAEQQVAEPHGLESRAAQQAVATWTCPRGGQAELLELHQGGGLTDYLLTGVCNAGKIAVLSSGTRVAGDQRKRACLPAGRSLICVTKVLQHRHHH